MQRPTSLNFSDAIFKDARMRMHYCRALDFINYRQAHFMSHSLECDGVSAEVLASFWFRLAFAKTRLILNVDWSKEPNVLRADFHFANSQPGSLQASERSALKKMRSVLIFWINSSAFSYKKHSRPTSSFSLLHLQPTHPQSTNQHHPSKHHSTTSPTSIQVINNGSYQANCP
jgi:hypothetical protein